MKIAFITTTFQNTTNGPAKFARLLHKHSEDNLKKLIIFTEDVDEPLENVVKVNIPALINISGLGFLYRLLAYFFKISRQPGIELVVANNTMYGFLFNLFSRKKVVGFINDDQHINPSLRFKYKAFRSFVFSKFEEFALKHNNITVVNSQHLNQALANAYSLPSDKLFTLYKGIEINENVQLNLEKHDKDEIFRMVFVKTNFRIGGLRFLLEAIQGIKNVHLDIITDPRVKKSKEYKLAQKLESVSFYHHLPQSRVFELLDNSHCLCIPAEKEALGVANMEGMHHSCVILTSDVGGIPEVLEGGKSGLLVPVGNIKALQEKILFLKNNRVERKKFVINGFHSVKRFSIRHSIESFYQRVDQVK